VVVKGSPCALAGNPPPRIVETPSDAQLHRLENIGLDAFLADKLPKLTAGARVIVNFYGGCREDYRELAARLDGVDGVDALEMNISCPNVKRGGVLIGQSRGSAPGRGRRAWRDALPPSSSSPPNVTDIRVTARRRRGRATARPDQHAAGHG
jgi:dihydroorotate dehydrogenase (NAD+) catalytic subunit